MYLGEVVEIAETGELFTSPQHPYTKALLEAIPEPEPDLARQREALTGEVPSPIEPPSGCSFHPRCPAATDECRRTDPVLESIDGASAGHHTACIHVDEFEPHTGIRTDDAIDQRYSVEQFDHAEGAAATDGGGE
jgi:peptide/nickel transport system ATP-binding protein/oligopeptide transport system ATP-binding protein